jgi:hypothetical protein
MTTVRDIVVIIMRRRTENGRLEIEMQIMLPDLDVVLGTEIKGGRLNGEMHMRMEKQNNVEERSKLPFTWG